MSRALIVLLLSTALAACAGENRVSASATKPMSPAEGAADYKHSPAGPAEKPVVPAPSGEPGVKAPEIVECPPKCNADGSWSGCGLKKSRGSQCQGCAPKCKGKGTPDEGWYDCNGVLIVQRPCGSGV